jgi:WD40 repeat protein
MGGLVVKKAFILGHQTWEFESVVRRIFAIFFLATPHQGAGLADTLSRLLALAPGSRPFVHDLSPESPVLQSINEEFPRYCSSLQLFSFFENKPMKLGIGNNLIVEKHCAVMNYPNERRTYLNANHRDVARFSLRNDPSYLMIRNALATTVESKRSLKASSKQKAGFDQIEALSTFLGISDAPDDDVIAQESIRLPRTCEWFIEKDGFKQWRNASMSKSLWLRGRPGAGKSVLSAHIINHLREQGQDCCFYFFSQGDKTKTTINSFLRSMVWQIAMLHPTILEAALDVATNWQATAINKVDHVPVWRRLYLSGILKTRLKRPQYWVIDALDECKGGAELMALLAKIQELWPLCLFVTARDPIDKYASSTNPRVEIMSEAIEEEDTNRDIGLFLKANQDLLPASGVVEREAMAEQILRNSNGCFLWVTLVLKELRQVHTSTEIRKVLSSNTADMDELYGRILSEMADARFGKGLAKAILTWTTFSFRPLSTDEIHCAIEADINDTIDDIEKSISTCCGNLVYVDRQRKVQLLHLTVRDFLTRQGMESEFMIDRATAHKRLALVCLRYLTSSEMRAFQPRKLSVTQLQEKPRLADYACKYVFQHLLHAKSNDGEVLAALSKFMGSNFVLNWIEHLATKEDLQRVFQAGKTINNLLNRLGQHSPLIGLRKELTLLQSWGNDLVRLVTKFGKELSLSPSAIHHLIPPFCPIESAPNRQFSSPHRGLSVYGQTTKGWDDCLSILNFSKPSRPLTVAVSRKFFALGMSTGKVIVYDDVTCQESNTLEHREPVWSLAFSDNGSMCASAGAKNIRIWDLNRWSELFHFTISSMCLSLTFAEEDMLLFAAIKNNELMCWDIANGGVLRETPTNWTIDLDEQSALHYRQPTLASFSPQQNLLAVVYRGEDILLWDFERDRIHDMYEKETGSRLHGSNKVSDGSTTVWGLVFSTVADSMLLAASYSDGDLVIYDTIDGTVKEFLTGVNAQRISCSPDGRTLACADSQGNIQLFDLETFKPLYRLQFDGDAISPRALAFTSDNHRLIDIRANQCRLWDPIVLLRQDMDDENSDTVSVSTAPPEVNFQGSTSVHVTAIECIPSESIVFCGKEDGSVCVYDITLKPHSTKIFIQTPGVPIILLCFDLESSTLTCSDAASKITSRVVRKKQRNRWITDEPMIDTRIGRNIVKILASGKHSRLLVSTDGRDYLWSTSKDSKQEPLVTRDAQDQDHWIQHGANPDALIWVSASTASIYHWETLEEFHTLSLADMQEPFTAVSSVITLRHPRYFATIAVDPSRAKSSQHVFYIYDFKDFTPEAHTVGFVQNLGTLSSVIDTVIGVSAERLVYLDTNNWICSAEIGSAEFTNVRHFFIPSDWVSLAQNLMLDIARNGEIIVIKRAELLVVKRGLEMTEKGTFNPPRKRSMSPRNAALASLSLRKSY